jgi:hypothetical protein
LKPLLYKQSPPKAVLILELNRWRSLRLALTVLVAGALKC